MWRRFRGTDRIPSIAIVWLPFVLFPPVGVAAALIALATSGPSCAVTNVPLGMTAIAGPLLGWIAVLGATMRNATQDVLESAYHRFRWFAYALGYWLIPLSVLVVACGVNSVLRSKGIECGA
ncbi:MAG: hypothetical protein DCC49_07095 [Acidobacteria bacterium]|nr:MAG: hypothetical protein DCC49_07095 [Acidobacteriota bacterium]